jgi:uncharacterized membrane protein
MNDERAGRTETVIASLFCVITAAVFILRAPLTASLWLDETLSAWIVMGSVDDVWHRSISFQGQSPLYYLLLWGWSKLFGASELALRSLSILFCGITLALMSLLARHLRIGTLGVVIAVSFLLAADVFQDAVLSARPYSFALMTAVASILLVMRLVNSFSVLNATLCVSSLVALFYAHYLFGLIALPHAVLLIQSRANARRIAPYLVVAGLCCIPGLLQVATLFARKSGLSFAAAPTGIALLKGWVPLAAGVAVVVGVLMAIIWGGKLVLSGAHRSALRILLPYVVLGPLPLMIVSALGSTSLWTPRYWSWQLVMMALAVGVVIESFSTRRARLTAVAATCAFLLLRVLSQDRVVEGWREAALLASKRAGPVALYSGLAEVESGVVDGVREYEQYLRTPFVVYGVNNEIRLMRMSDSDAEIVGKMRGASSLVVQRRVRRGGEELSPYRFKKLLSENGLSIEEEKTEGTVTWISLR